MKKIRAFLVRLAATLGRASRDDDIREELDSHLAMQIDDNVRAGMTFAEGRRDALLRAGGLESASQAVRDQRGLPLLETIAADLRYAQRTLRRAGGFTGVVIVTLAIGIGASTAIFSLVTAVVLRPLPYRDPSRVVMLWTDDPLHDVHEEGVSYPNFRDWRSMSQSFDDMALRSRQTRATISSIVTYGVRSGFSGT